MTQKRKNTTIKGNNESKAEFRLIYAGKDKSMKYFADHNVDQWDYNSFKEHVNTNNRPSVVESSLSNMYELATHNILKRKTLPKHVRARLEGFRKDFHNIGESSRAPAPSSTYNISYQIGGNARPTILQNNNATTINVVTDSENTENEDKEEEIGNSFSSADYSPRATTKSYVILHNTDDDDKDEDINDNEKWLFDEVDLTTYLLDYRKKSLYMNQERSDIELSPARLLSMSYIYLFPLKSSESCLKNLPNTLLSIINVNLDESSVPSIPSKITMFADELLEAYASKDEGTVAVKSGEILIESGKAEANRDLLIKAANTIIDVAKQINRYSQGTHTIDSNGEDTFVQGFLSPWVNNIFYGESFGVKWANAQLAAFTGASDTSKLYPDFTMYTVINNIRFDVFAIEVKPPGQTRCLTDQRKIGYELQKMIDALVDACIPSPADLWGLGRW